MHLSETQFKSCFTGGPIMIRSRMTAGMYVRVGSMKASEGDFQQIILSQHHTQSELPRSIP